MGNLAVTPTPPEDKSIFGRASKKRIRDAKEKEKEKEKEVEEDSPSCENSLSLSAGARHLTHRQLELHDDDGEGEGEGDGGGGRSTLLPAKLPHAPPPIPVRERGVVILRALLHTWRRGERHRDEHVELVEDVTEDIIRCAQDFTLPIFGRRMFLYLPKGKHEDRCKSLHTSTTDQSFRFEERLYCSHAMHNGAPLPKVVQRREGQVRDMEEAHHLRSSLGYLLKHRTWPPTERLELELEVDGERIIRTLTDKDPFFIASEFYLQSSILDDVLQNSYMHFDEEEAQVLYEVWRELTWPNVVLTQDRFVQLLPHFNDRMVLSSLFSALDRNSDNEIDFKEFIIALSIMRRGNINEKINLSFEISDLDGDGEVHIEEVRKIYGQMVAIMKSHGLQPEEFGDLDSVQSLFQRSVQFKGRKKDYSASTAMQSFLMEPKERQGVDLYHRHPLKKLKERKRRKEREKERRGWGTDTEERYNLDRIERRGGYLDEGYTPREASSDTEASAAISQRRHPSRKEIEDAKRAKGSKKGAFETNGGEPPGRGLHRRRPSHSLVYEGTPGDVFHRAKTKAQSKVAAFERKRWELGGDIEEQDSGEFEEGDETQILATTVDKHEFVRRARNEPDIINCFGVFDFLATLVVIPLEDKLREYRGAHDSYSGLLKVKHKKRLLYRSHRYWTEVRNGFFIGYRHNYGESDSESRTKVRLCVPLSSATVYSRELRKPFRLYCSNVDHEYHLRAPDTQQHAEWVKTIRDNISKHNPSKVRFRSFAPSRENIRVRAFINGKHYFEALANCIHYARHSIFIADWYLTPGIFLKRDCLEERNQLDHMLLCAAERGVQVYVLVWNQTLFAGLYLESKRVTSHLNGLHPNIHAMRHPRVRPLAWSHHQKIVVIDEAVAFLGGIDLCFLRYDDHMYLLTDPQGKFFPGSDYSNLSVAPEYNGDPIDGNAVDRNSVARMPWHDIQIAIDGDACRDVAVNFIERWNHATNHGGLTDNGKKTYIAPARKANAYTQSKLLRTLWHNKPLTPQHEHEHDEKPKEVEEQQQEEGKHDIVSDKQNKKAKRKDKGKDKVEENNSLAEQTRAESERKGNIVEQHDGGGEVFIANCQVLRSVSSWSAGVDQPENSIYRAYLYAIRKAEHFIYIENQYFISSINRIRPKNRIAKALYKRIRKAILRQENFKVIVIIPIYPSGDLTQLATRIVIKYVYKTISRQGNSILELLSNEFSPEVISNYITFFSLRNWGTFKPGGTPVSEMVYVHAKLMVVDDRITIIGSANINDRSLRGTRDSEIAVLLESKPENMIDSVMDGKPFKVCPFAHSLRVQLWSHYLGIARHQQGQPSAVPYNERKVDSYTDAQLREMIVDPVSDEVYHGLWMATARNNTDTYLRVFKYMPDVIYNVDELKDAYLKTKRVIEKEMAGEEKEKALAVAHRREAASVATDDEYDNNEEEGRGRKGKEEEEEQDVSSSSTSSKGGRRLTKEDKLKILQKEIRGYLVFFPLLFLKDEQMSPTLLDKENVVPKNVFV